LEHLEDALDYNKNRRAKRKTHAARLITNNNRRAKRKLMLLRFVSAYLNPTECMRGMRQSSADILIMITLLVARFVFLLFSPAGLSGDAFGYVQTAQHIIDSGRLPPLTAQPMGYSILIAPLLFASGAGIARAVVVMNSLMDCSVVAILLHSAKRLFPFPYQRNVRLLCWLVAIIQPFTAETVTSVLTETPVMFFNFVGIWLLFASRSFIGTACGMASLGLASLLRIDILLLNAICVIIYLAFFEGMKCRKGAGIKACLVFLTFPGLMLIYQFYSSQQIGLIRYEPRFPGYDIWMRSWFALQKSEYERFAFDVGTSDWFGFDVVNYPARAFDSIAEHDRVSELLRTWRSEGYSTSVDRGFRDVGHNRFAHHPMRSFILVPTLRMAHYWINLDGALPYIRVMSIQRPFSTLIVAFALLLRLLLIFLAALGAYAIWFWQRAPVDKQLYLARFGSLVVLLRTMELGALGAILQRGLMEARYVVVAFPFLILLSFWGLHFLFVGEHPNIGVTTVRRHEPLSYREVDL
jgi:hypothetical protein